MVMASAPPPLHVRFSFSAFHVPWLNIALCCFSVAGYSGSVRGPQYLGDRCLRWGSVAGATFLPWGHSPLSRYVQKLHVDVNKLRTCVVCPTMNACRTRFALLARRVIA
jgi:hypothetical protein